VANEVVEEARCKKRYVVVRVDFEGI